MYAVDRKPSTVFIDNLKTKERRMEWGERNFTELSNPEQAEKAVGKEWTDCQVVVDHPTS